MGKASLSDPLDRQAYFEQRIFVFSPFGTFPTAALIFVILFGAFLLIAAIEHVPIYSSDANGITVSSATRMAFTLSLMLCTSLFIQRYTRVKERADHDAFAAVLKPGAMQARNLMQLTPGNARLGLFTAIGLVLGFGLSWPLFSDRMFNGSEPTYGLFSWFVVTDTLLAAAFVRGVELSRTGSVNTAEAIEHELIVDLLRIDLLSVWGRYAARFALIWFTVSAVACLFFIDNGLNAFTISMLATFLALGIWVFVLPMERVHRKIRAAKAIELERVRKEIDGVRASAVKDADAATRLQGLLAYETRISAAPEWPFDQTTLYRVGASALILTVPWFGQAIVQFAIEQMGH